MEIYEYTTRNGKTRYMIAHWDERAGQFIGPMNEEGRRLTGCHSLSARTEGTFGNDPNARTYSTLSAARRALRRTEF